MLLSHARGCKISQIRKKHTQDVCCGFFGRRNEHRSFLACIPDCTGNGINATKQFKEDSVSFGRIPPIVYLPPFI